MKDRLTQTLWHLYHRPERPSAPNSNRDLPWHDSAFSERMLREHLDEQHGAASRVSAERAAQVEWLWNQLGLQTNHHLFDITCGPGLYAIPFAQRGCQVTGIDISPAAIAYAQDLARSERLSARCSFIEQDIRQMRVPPASFDGAILLYGQLSILSTDEAQTLLTQIAQTLKSGAKLCIELLNPDKIAMGADSGWFVRCMINADARQVRVDFALWR
ncbi:MAG: methyltransferase domain-containing protein, partial [Chloroflexota bacterium]